MDHASSSICVEKEGEAPLPPQDSTFDDFDEDSAAGEIPDEDNDLWEGLGVDDAE